MRNLPYLFLKGLRNIFKHMGSSMLSLSIIAFTIFLFASAFAVLTNIRAIVENAEDTVGITVFFDEGLSEEEILAIGETIGANEEVDRMVYTSAEEAWENFKTVYFEGNEELADGFIDDNPLASCASYEIFLEDISRQQEFIEYLEEIDGVRKINASNVAAEGLSSIGGILRSVTSVALILLLVVAVTLISNSVSLTISASKDEIHIMRYLGASGSFICLPFMIEGILIGLAGAAIPTAVVYYGYDEAVASLKYRLSVFGNFLEFLPKNEIFIYIVPVSLILGVGVGLAGSLLSIRKHLRV